jgi:hypothetical protein
MVLVRNPSADTLGEEAQDRPEVEHLRWDGTARQDAGRETYRSGRLSGAVDGEGGNGVVFAAVAGIAGGELYADQVFETLKNGASARTKSGEQTSLPPQSLTSRVTSQGDTLIAGEYPGSTLYPASSSNYSVQAARLPTR